MPKWIHNDQVEFVFGQEGKENCLKTLFLIDEAKKRNNPVLLQSTDAEKVFDRIDLEFMFETLRYLGIGIRIMRWIIALQYHPTAKIRVNGRSIVFELFIGTRQGSSLMPMLFILALKSLLMAI